MPELVPPCPAWFRRVYPKPTGYRRFHTQAVRDFRGSKRGPVSPRQTRNPPKRSIPRFTINTFTKELESNTIRISNAAQDMAGPCVRGRAFELMKHEKMYCTAWGTRNCPTTSWGVKRWITVNTIKNRKSMTAVKQLPAGRRDFGVHCGMAFPVSSIFHGNPK